MRTHNRKRAKRDQLGRSVGRGSSLHWLTGMVGHQPAKKEVEYEHVDLSDEYWRKACLLGSMTGSRNSLATAVDGRDKLSSYFIVT